MLPKIGRYRILKELGKGAFGVSYVAYDPLLDQKLVIKVARSDHSDDVKRLEHEANALSKLTHPNISRIYDVGTTEDGLFYIVTELVEGESLTSILEKDGTLKPEKIYKIVENLAKALSYAHSKGFIHRDIKPSNILITPDGVAKIIDFGLAGELEIGTDQTVVGQIFGTPAYMSPEQLRGQPQSPASDVYNLGIVIFEMVYGRTPFKGLNRLDLIQAVFKGDIDFPSTPIIPQGLKTLLQRCTDPDPQQRISSGEELVGTIAAFYLSENEVDFEVDKTVVRSLPRTTSSKKKAFPIILISIGFLAAFILVWMIFGGPTSNAVMLIRSIVLIFVSLLFGVKLGEFLNRSKPEAQRKAENILIGTADRDSLTKSIAIEIDGLFDRLKTFDERFLAQSIALVLKDYEGAKEIDDRQKALMNAVTIVEKLKDRLSPWYVRHEKAVAFVVSSVGIISGVVTATATIMKMISK